MKKISVIIPVFNEEKVLHILYGRLKNIMELLKYDFEVIFVNDGSCDGTSDALNLLQEKDKRVKTIEFSRNFGQQNALMAGLDYAAGDAAVLMDADLEDDPKYIADFVSYWENGYDVVYAKRGRRKAGWLKNAFFNIFHKANYLITNIKIDATGNFCLMDAKIIRFLKSLPEKERYLPGLRSWVGFKQAGLEVERGSRYDGRARVSIPQLFKLAFDSFTSFSTLPLEATIFIGLLFFLLSFAGIACIFFMKIFLKLAVQGWASILTVILLIGGIQLICIGLQGQYIGRIFNEVKNRPHYIIMRKTGFEE